MLRNYKSELTKMLGTIRTRRRVVLTGTPLQNNLMEYYCMVNFVRPNYLGTPIIVMAYAVMAYIVMA